MKFGSPIARRGELREKNISNCADEFPRRFWRMTHVVFILQKATTSAHRWLPLFLRPWGSSTGWFQLIVMSKAWSCETLKTGFQDVMGEAWSDAEISMMKSIKDPWVWCFDFWKNHAHAKKIAGPSICSLLSGLGEGTCVYRSSPECFQQCHSLIDLLFPSSYAA